MGITKTLNQYIIWKSQLPLNRAYIKRERCPRLSCRGCRFIHVTETFFPRPRLVRGSEEERIHHTIVKILLRYLFALCHIIYSVSALSTKKSLSVKGKPMKENSINGFSTKKTFNSNANVKKSRGWLCMFLNTSLSLRK